MNFTETIRLARSAAAWWLIGTAIRIFHPEDADRVNFLRASRRSARHHKIMPCKICRDYTCQGSTYHEINGPWGPRDSRRLFVNGAKYWEYHVTGATMWNHDVAIVEAEAERRYGVSAQGLPTTGC